MLVSICGMFTMLYIENNKLHTQYNIRSVGEPMNGGRLFVAFEKRLFGKTGLKKNGMLKVHECGTKLLLLSKAPPVETSPRGGMRRRYI